MNDLERRRELVAFRRRCEGTSAQRNGRHGLRAANDRREDEHGASERVTHLASSGLRKSRSEGGLERTHGMRALYAAQSRRYAREDRSFRGHGERPTNEKRLGEKPKRM